MKKLDALIGKEVSIRFEKYGFATGKLVKLPSGKYSVKVTEGSAVEFAPDKVVSITGNEIKLYTPNGGGLLNGQQVVIYYGPVVLYGGAQWDEEYIGVAGQWLRADRLIKLSPGVYMYNEGE